MAKFIAAVVAPGAESSANNPILYGLANAVQKKGGKLIGFIGGILGILPSEGTLFEKVYPDVSHKLLEERGKYTILTPEQIPKDQGGCIIQTSRTSLLSIEDGVEIAYKELKKLDVEYLFWLGGDGTATQAYRVSKEFEKLGGGIEVMILSRTMDNDLGSNPPADKPFDFTKMVNIWDPGFPSAVKMGRDVAQTVHPTAYSRRMVLVDEVRGRNSGFLALAMGYLGKAQAIIIPEQPERIEHICQTALINYEKDGYFYCVVPEGAVELNSGEKFCDLLKKCTKKTRKNTEKLGEPGDAAKYIAKQIKKYFKRNSKHIDYCEAQVLQRISTGVPPTKLDMDTSIELGYHAMMSMLDGKGHGYITVLLFDGEKVVPSSMPLEKAVALDIKDYGPLYGNMQDVTVIQRLVQFSSDPARSFYDPRTLQPTKLGIKYIEMLKVPPIQIQKSTKIQRH